MIDYLKYGGASLTICLSIGQSSLQATHAQRNQYREARERCRSLSVRTMKCGP